MIRRCLSSFSTQSVSLFGQPHWSTHPHVISTRGHITPYLSQQDYATRRHSLAQQLPPKSAILVPSYAERIMANDIPYEFRQATSFLYLSGCLEPDSLLLIETDANRKPTSTLFLPPRDPSRELWDGPRTGAPRAPSFFVVDSAHPLPEAPAILRPVLERVDDIFYESPVPSAPHVDHVLRQAFAGLSSTQQKQKLAGTALTRVLESMRLVKSDAEIRVMQHSASIAAAAFADVMSEARPGELERALAASLDYHCRRRGAARLSFPPVVANGRNALTIHYVANDALLRDGDLVLLDGGCEFGGYASDITRTFPVGPRFTDAQRDVYERVLDVNLRCIEHCDLARHSEPLTLAALQHAAERWLTEHLLDMRILNGTLVDALSRRAHDRFYPHNIGHWLGMDTHDTPHMSTTTTTLRPSMCITIEPGLYIGADETIPSQYHNIGIRIEDDIVLRHNAPPTVLTHEIVKTVPEIEALRARATRKEM